jgi:hypothetical protein
MGRGGRPGSPGEDVHEGSITTLVIPGALGSALPWLAAGMLDTAVQVMPPSFELMSPLFLGLSGRGKAPGLGETSERLTAMRRGLGWITVCRSRRPGR